MRIRKPGRKNKRFRPCPGPGFREDRRRLVQVGVALGFAIVLVRAIMLHVFPASEDSLTTIAKSQYHRELELAPYRGPIYDRRGTPLAISIRKPSIAVNPRVFDPTAEEIRFLAKHLRLTRQTLRDVASRTNYFAWLRRQLDPERATALLNRDIKGLFKVPEPTRFYPAGRGAAHLLGFVGIDNDGLFGLERQYNEDLEGRSIHLSPTRDARGRTIFRESAAVAAGKTGNSLHLTLDRVIQEITEEELRRGIERSGAKKGFAIAADPHTGRILAVANHPGFDPNNSRRVNIQRTRNHALLDTFEPGSITKPFLVARALDQNIVKQGERFNCEEGAMRIGGHRIHDTHPADELTTAGTVIESSNICTFKIAQAMGKDQAYRSLRSFGFDRRKTWLGFPAESYGRILSWDRWRDIRFANIAFGQGFTTTGLEMVGAMSAIANGGNLVAPVLVERIESEDGIVVSSNPTRKIRRVIRPDTAKTMRSILQRVVEQPRGTGNEAATDRYTTAGKTGTAQKVVPGVKGYSEDKYIASFVGFAPVEDPHMVIFVLIDEPAKKPYYGGLWAAPVFSAIAERSLKYLGVPPDRRPSPDTAKENPNAGTQPAPSAPLETARSNRKADDPRL